MLTRVTDHSDYPYCYYKTAVDKWGARSEHIRYHYDLKVAAGLVLQLRQRGANIKRSFNNLFSRSGTLKSLQSTLTSYYGPGYDLESLYLPWILFAEDFRVATSFPEERMCRLPGDWDQDEVKGKLCKFYRGAKPQKCRLCGMIQIQTPTEARIRATRDRKCSLLFAITSS